MYVGSGWLGQGLLTVGTLCTAALPASAQQATRVNAALARATVGDVTGFRFSPDSTHVVYRADQEADEVYRLYAVPSEGGPVVALGPLPVAGGDAQDFQVSPDGRVVVYRADQDADEVSELYVSSITGRLPVTKLNGPLVLGGDVLEFALAAGTRRVVYLADQQTDGRAELFSVSQQGGTPRKLNGPLVAGGNVERFLVSPDGRHVVYAADASTDGVLELYQAPISGGAPVLLGTGLPSAWAFEISPDSKGVVFQTRGVDYYTNYLYRVSILGGPAKELSATALPGLWISPDSRRVVFLAYGVQTRAQLWSVPTLGGPVRKLTEHGNGRIWDLRISPDSRRVAYSVEQGDSVSAVYTVPIKGGPISVITDGDLGNEINVGQFTPDSSHLVFVVLLSLVGDGPILYRASSTGGARTRLTDRQLYGGEITPDSGLVVCFEAYRNNLFSVALASGDEVQLNAPAFVGGGVQQTRLSPDGTRVAFLADQDGDDVRELFSVPVGGGPIVKLNAALVLGGVGGDVQESALSPDGAWVVYTADQETDQVFELYSAPVAGGPPVKLNGALVRNGDVDLFDFRVSPDSHWVVYAADQEVGAIRELYRVPIEGGPALKLNAARGTVSGVADFEISPDSRRVVYQNDPDPAFAHRLFSVSIDGGPSAEFVEPVDGQESFFQISPDSTRVVYVFHPSSDGALRGLYGGPLEGGPALRLHPAPVELGGILGLPQILADSSGVVYAADLETDNVFELFLSPLVGGTTTKLSGPLVPGGDVGSFALSSDSSRVAYLADAEVDDVRELFSVSLAGLARAKLNPPMVSGGDVRELVISPDSARVVYLADQGQDETLELYSVSIAGGPATRLNPPLVAGGDVGFARTFQVSSDSARVVYLADQAADGVVELFSVPLAGGPVAKLNAPLPPGGDVEPVYWSFQISADASRVVFVAEQRVDERVELYSALISGGQPPTRLNPDLAANGDVAAGSPFFGPFQLVGERVLYHADQDQDEVYELYLSVLPFTTRATRPTVSAASPPP